MSFSLCLPAWSIGSDAYNDIEKYVSIYGKKAAVIGGHTALSKAYPRIKSAVSKTDIILTEPIWFLGNSSFEKARALAEREDVKSADMIFAVGGGKACDAGKILGHMTGKPVFTFPTLISNCAAVTSIAVIYDDQDRYTQVLYADRCPEHCFIDTQVLADSPIDMLWAGIGDTAAKELEVEMASRNEEDMHVITMGKVLSHACTQALFKYSKDSLDSIKKKQSSIALEEIALHIIVTSGIVSCMCTGTYENGDNYFYIGSAAHTFYNGTAAVKRERVHLHGEQVAFGVLVLLVLDDQNEKIDEWLRFAHSIGLPVTLAQMDFKAEDMPSLVDLASKSVEWTKIPGSVSKEEYIMAILKADNIGQRFLSNAGACK